MACTGRSCCLLSSGCDRGIYYRVAHGTALIPNETQFPCRTLVACLGGGGGGDSFCSAGPSPAGAARAACAVLLAASGVRRLRWRPAGEAPEGPPPPPRIASRGGHAPGAVLLRRRRRCVSRAAHSSERRHSPAKDCPAPNKDAAGGAAEGYRETSKVCLFDSLSPRNAPPPSPPPFEPGVPASPPTAPLKPQSPPERRRPRGQGTGPFPMPPLVPQLMDAAPAGADADEAVVESPAPHLPVDSPDRIELVSVTISPPGGHQGPTLCQGIALPRVPAVPHRTCAVPWEGSGRFGLGPGMGGRCLNTRTRGLARRRRPLFRVADLCVTVEIGKSLVIMGPSGCGKSRYGPDRRLVALQ